MELFLLFLVGCFILGMTATNMSMQHQVWLVIVSVLLLTLLYFINPGLL